MTTMNNFIGLSAVLTGFNQNVLAPGLDPVDIKTAYLSEWQTQVANESGDNGLTDAILALYQSLSAQTPPLSDQQIGEAMLSDDNGDEFVLACRKLIFLWYMGAWPNVMADTTSSNMLSSESYTSGLVWKVMQAHPMGDSNYRYGYWSQDPGPLDSYTGNSDN